MAQQHNTQPLSHHGVHYADSRGKIIREPYNVSCYNFTQSSPSIIVGGVRIHRTVGFAAHYSVFLRSMFPFLLSPIVVPVCRFHLVSFVAKFVARISTLGKATGVSYKSSGSQDKLRPMRRAFSSVFARYATNKYCFGNKRSSSDVTTSVTIQ